MALDTLLGRRERTPRTKKRALCTQVGVAQVVALEDQAGEPPALERVSSFGEPSPCPFPERSLQAPVPETKPLTCCRGRLRRAARSCPWMVQEQPGTVTHRSSYRCLSLTALQVDGPGHTVGSVRVMGQIVIVAGCEPGNDAGLSPAGRRTGLSTGPFARKGGLGRASGPRHARSGCAECAALAATGRTGRPMTTTENRGHEAGRFGFRPDVSIQEIGYDEDVDQELRDAIEQTTGTELVDEDPDDAVDVVVLWFRAGDGDLTGVLGNAFAPSRTAAACLAGPRHGPSPPAPTGTAAASSRRRADSVRDGWADTAGQGAARRPGHGHPAPARHPLPGRGTDTAATGPCRGRHTVCRPPRRMGRLNRGRAAAQARLLLGQAVS